MNPIVWETGGDDVVEVDQVRDALRDLYRQLDGELARLGPVCQLSGRCCRFAEYGHTLFVSAAEAALLVADAPPAIRGLDDGATCPWQDARGRCQARDARPLGCRVYFCDPTHAEATFHLGEESLAQLKRLVEERGLPWDYAPLHRHLARAAARGRWAPPPTSPELALTGANELDTSPSQPYT